MKALSFLVCLALTATAFGEEPHPLSQSALIHWRQFIGTIKSAQKVVVYYGTPRRRDKDSKPTESTIEIEDFEFYKEPREVPIEIAARLLTLVSDLTSFSDYRGMKFCGGFHPDLCIEWQFEQNGQRWHKRAFACLGCHEWRLGRVFKPLEQCRKIGFGDARMKTLKRFELPEPLWRRLKKLS